MKLTVKQLNKLTKDFLSGLGYVEQEVNYIAENLIEAQMSGRKTHGLVRLLGFKKSALDGKIITKYEDLDIISETPNSLHIDGHNKLGYSVIYRSLELAIKKVKQAKIVMVGLKDIGISGYIGAYARKATEQDLIFIGFNNSPGGLVPYGAKKELWGTDPLTIGVPTNNIPVILDMASTMITWGDLLVAKNEGKPIKEGVAIDNDGNPTTEAEKAMGGGLLPIAGHKGSGLAFIVELLGGALTGSRVGYSVPGGWGSFYILIDPTLFRRLSDFKCNVETAIKELKNAPKMNGFNEIYFAGEQSYKKMEEALKDDRVEVNDTLYKSITEN